MSPLKFGTLISGLCAIVIVIATAILETTANEPLMSHAIHTLFSIIAVVSWPACAVAHCRDSIVKHIDRTAVASVDQVVPNTNNAMDIVLAAIRDTVNDVAERRADERATEARLDTLARLGHIPADPPAGNGHRPVTRIGPHT